MMDWPGRRLRAVSELPIVANKSAGRTICREPTCRANCHGVEPGVAV
jgi:hypothetical protein